MTIATASFLVTMFFTMLIPVAMLVGSMRSHFRWMRENAAFLAELEEGLPVE